MHPLRPPAEFGHKNSPDRPRGTGTWHRAQHGSVIRMEIYCAECGNHVVTVHPNTRRSPLNPVPSGTEMTDLDKYVELWLHDFPFGGRHRPADIAESFNWWAQVNGIPPVTQRALTTALMRRGAQWSKTNSGRIYYLPEYRALGLALRLPGDQSVRSVRDRRLAQGIHPNLPVEELRERLRAADYAPPETLPVGGDHPTPDQGEHPAS